MKKVCHNNHHPPKNKGKNDRIKFNFMSSIFLVGYEVTKVAHPAVFNGENSTKFHEIVSEFHIP